MKRNFALYGFLLILWGFFSQGCIHEYPVPVKGNGSGNDNHTPDIGEDPTTIETYLQCTFEISWENISHIVEIGTKTKARTERPHRFVIELLKDGEVVCRDYEYLNPDDFSLGKLKHKLSSPLGASIYDIAVWYDLLDEEGNSPFSVEDLHEVSLMNFSTTDAEALQCAYASDSIDLRGYDVSSTQFIEKELEMIHPGARFEIVSTDIQQFITNNKEALNQGDSFTVNLSISGNTSNSFNLHAQSLYYGGEKIFMSGRMRLPFAEYDELKIAEGFIFCRDEDEVSMQMSIKNKSLVTVSQTEYFTFPVKRGHITTVFGDFLTHPVDGIFNINTIWEGEIVIEI